VKRRSRRSRTLEAIGRGRRADGGDNTRDGTGEYLGYETVTTRGEARDSSAAAAAAAAATLLPAHAALATAEDRAADQCHSSVTALGRALHSPGIAGSGVRAGCMSSPARFGGAGPPQRGVLAVLLRWPGAVTSRSDSPRSGRCRAPSPGRWRSVPP
jgi:hypothetical protein